jgi:spoIIIJ-associated protein
VTILVAQRRTRITHAEGRFVMKSIEISAKSEEEAVDIALAELGLSRSEVEVVVVKRGRSGLFGLGSEEVRVQVTPLELLAGGEVDVGAMGKEVLEKVLELMAVPANVVLQSRAPGDQEAVCLDIEGDDLGILIGRRGETLGLVVDVEGYRQRRYESLRQLARRLAEQVRSTGRSVTLEPMPAGERRIIHLELRDSPHVTTQSIGEGDARKIAILSKGNSTS